MNSSNSTSQQEDQDLSLPEPLPAKKSERKSESLTKKGSGRSFNFRTNRTKIEEMLKKDSQSNLSSTTSEADDDKASRSDSISTIPNMPNTDNLSTDPDDIMYNPTPTKNRSETSETDISVKENAGGSKKGFNFRNKKSSKGP